jgi:predicted PurR-regulated permease PerM
MAHRFVTEASQGIEQVQAKAEAGRWRKAIERNPQLAPWLDWVEANVDVEREIERAARHFAGDLVNVVTGSVWAIVQLLIMLLVLFYFFRDSRPALAALRGLVPLSRGEIDQVFHRVVDMVHAIVYGTLLVALVQGALGGLMFWWLGLPSPVLWGIVMALAAVVPWPGTFVVWVPAAVFLGLEGSWVKAAILTGWGLVVVGLIDNLLYPVLVGNRIRLHTLPVFFAIVGGLLMFGGSGIILGPLILAITCALLDIWRRRAADPETLEKHVTS